MHNWKKIILRQTDTMQTAIRSLEEESLRFVMVVDDYERLVGTVTDGDIRRGLIKQLSMNVKLDEIMHRKPTVASISDDKSFILAKMKRLDLLQIPIVDNDGRVFGLETLHHLLEKNKFDNPVFLMAGGFGKRLSSLTNDTPKPLLRVGKKPILENILNQFISAGFHNFYISIYYKADMLQKYFGDGSDWGVSIKYVREKKPLGTAGSLGLLPNDLPKLPILMMNGDLLTKVCFEELLSFHLQEDGDATMCVREYDFQVPYGVIKANGSHITNITEKPIHRFFVNAGVYVLNHSILDLVNGEDYMDMPQLLEKKIKDSGQVNMFPVHEYWLDIGQKEQFDQAQQDIEIWHE
jgi:dTDP-glucose pyrophosphorylase/predicted transcriptional regulator